MTLNEYQVLASRTINLTLNRAQQADHALHEMASEVGEIHGIYQKAYQGHTINDGDLKNEIGDLLWGISELCTAKGWKLDDIAGMNIAKLKKRYPEGFDPERSLHREQYE